MEKAESPTVGQSLSSKVNRMFDELVAFAKVPESQRKSLERLALSCKEELATDINMVDSAQKGARKLIEVSRLTANTSMTSPKLSRSRRQLEQFESDDDADLDAEDDHEDTRKSFESAYEALMNGQETRKSFDDTLRIRPRNKKHQFSTPPASSRFKKHYEQAKSYSADKKHTKHSTRHASVRRNGYGEEHFDRMRHRHPGGNLLKELLQDEEDRSEQEEMFSSEQEEGLQLELEVDEMDDDVGERGEKTSSGRHIDRVLEEMEDEVQLLDQRTVRQKIELEKRLGDVIEQLALRIAALEAEQKKWMNELQQKQQQSSSHPPLHPELEKRLSYLENVAARLENQGTIVQSLADHVQQSVLEIGQAIQSSTSSSSRMWDNQFVAGAEDGLSEEQIEAIENIVANAIMSLDRELRDKIKRDMIEMDHGRKIDNTRFEQQVRDVLARVDLLENKISDDQEHSLQVLEMLCQEQDRAKRAHMLRDASSASRSLSSPVSRGSSTLTKTKQTGQHPPRRYSRGVPPQ